jgi:NAD(P)-dependent dehydrogenase (short-subunit alcohol dehydrogenase family)
VLSLEESEATDPVELSEGDGVLDGQRFVIVTDARGAGHSLADILVERGAEVQSVAPGAPLPAGGRIDGMVHLAALDRGRSAVLPEAYEALREALLRGAERLAIVTGQGGMLGHGVPHAAPAGSRVPADVGLPGLARTLSREFPEVLVRCLDIDPAQPAATVARQILSELLESADAGGATVVGRTRHSRTTLVVRPAPLIGAAPALDLGPDSVVLLTGGARGITAKTAFALADATGCHLELIGRASVPVAAEEDDIAPCAGQIEIRRALMDRGMRVPAEIETELRRLLAEREVRRNLTAFATVAASVRYHPLDVRDAAGVQSAVEAILDRHGRLDGVVHGAGVLDDRLVRDKTPASFRDVFATKVLGAQTLASALELGLAARGCEDPAFLVFFGSVSGVFGNRGQADYAAANDALGTLSRAWGDRFAGQVLSVDWGPWESVDGGMVSADLKREYERRGIGLIDPAHGAACLLEELAAGQGGSRVRAGTSQVVYLCGELEAYGATPAESGEPASQDRVTAVA